MVLFAKSGCVLMPVPTAMSPNGSPPRLPSAAVESRRCSAHLAGITAELLPEPDRRGILQVGPADFQNLRRTPSALRRQRRVQFRLAPE